MFSSLNNSFHKNKNLFVVVFGLLILSFILTLSDVNITDLTGRTSSNVGTIGTEEISQDKYKDLAAKESIVLSLSLRRAISLNNSDSRHIQEVLIQTAFDNKIQEAIKSGTFQAPVIDTQKMQDFASEAQLTSENIKSIRNNLGVGGAEVDEAIKKLITRRAFFESFEEKVVIDEAKLQEKAKQQNSVITFQGKTFSANEAIDQKLIAYYAEKKSQFSFEDTITAKIVRFPKTEEGKKAAQTFSEAATKVQISNFGAVAKSQKLKTVDLPKTRISSINAGELVENDFKLSTTLIELSKEKPVSGVIEGTTNNYVAALIEKGGVLPFSQVRNLVIAAYFGEERIKGYYDSNKARFLIPRSLQCSVISLAPSALYGEVSVSEEEVKAQYDKNITDYKVAQIKSTEYSITAKDEKSLEVAEKALKAIKVLVDSNAKNLEEELKKNSDIKTTATNWIKKTDDNKELFEIAKGKSSEIEANELKFSFTSINDKRDETPYAEAAKDIENKLTHSKARSKATIEAEKLQAFIGSNKSKENFFQNFLAESAKYRFTERKLRPVTFNANDSQFTMAGFNLFQQGYTPVPLTSQQSISEIGRRAAILSAQNPISDPSITDNGDIQYLLVETEVPVSYVDFENAKDDCGLQVALAEGKILAKAKADNMKNELENAEDTAAYLKAQSFNAEEKIDESSRTKYTALLNDEILALNSAYTNANANDTQLIYVKTIEAGTEDKVKESLDSLIKSEKSRLAYEKADAVMTEVRESVKLFSSVK